MQPLLLVPVATNMAHGQQSEWASIYPNDVTHKSAPAERLSHVAKVFEEDTTGSKGELLDVERLDVESWC